MEQFQLPTLVIISDNFSVCYWLKKRLETQFYIIEATKLKKALEVAQHTALDFIILDSSFEECDVLELCHQIRRYNKLTPILFITGKLKKSYRQSALDAGVTDFLFEQLDEEELKIRITTGLKTAEVRHKVQDLSGKISIAQDFVFQNHFKTIFLLQTQTLQLIADAREHHLPLTLLFIRIDHFNKLRGREVLGAFSLLLHQNIGAKDLLIPLGNGEFILLLSKTLEEGEKIAAVILKKIERHRFETALGAQSITATLVITDIGSSETPFNEMIDAAEKALKQADTVTNMVLSIKRK
jgi:diguanylate cyclase (GGDEF)-like protein